MVTNGDYGCIDYSKGYARLKESLAGLETLGSNKESFEIMGYADTGMPERESFLTHLYYEKNEQDHSTGRCGYYLLYFTYDGYGIRFQLCYEPVRGDS